MRSSIHFPITVLFVILTEAIIRGGFKPDLVEVETDEHIVEAVQRPHPELAILPGELPGYTGWARPITTLADYFVSKFPSTPIVAGEQFSFQVECSHEECSKGGSLFFVRAYGPAILTGTMKDHHNGTYTVSFLPHDGGSYQLEVVITCSRRVKLNDFPTADQPGYEGYLLPGYPKSIQVVTSSPLSESKTDDLPICTGKEILQTTQLSALEQARWVVASKLRNRPFSANSTLEEADTKKYAKGVGGIGFRMKYEPRNECRWLSATELQETRTINKIRAKSKLVDKPLHIVFIGDSNMFRVMYSFEKHYEKQLPWHLTKIPTHGGLHMRMDRIQTALDELTLLDHKFIILFNSGLHDILQLCFKDRAEFREETFNRTDDKISCAREYKDIVAKFVDMVEKFPAIHRVWQTTTVSSDHCVEMLALFDEFSN